MNTGGLDAILRAMRVMKNSVSVQARGCAALGNLALVDSMSRATIAAKGGVDLILDAMRVHSDHGPVQAWGCDALANLSLDVDLYKYHLTLMC